MSEEDLARSNMDGFGDSIGSITNRVTAMFEVRSKYAVGSNEHKVLSYRIMCGQLYQQNEIDRLKGVQSKPMPDYWYKVEDKTDDNKKNSRFHINRDIVASKRPWFMNYRYPQQMSEYKKYMKSAQSKSLRVFKKPLDDLIESKCLSSKEIDFLKWYYSKMPAPYEYIECFPVTIIKRTFNLCRDLTLSITLSKKKAISRI